MSASADHLLGAEELRTWATKLLLALNVPDEEARLISRLLVNADMRGMHTHGVAAISMYADYIKEGLIKPDRKPEIRNESQAAVHIDGNFGFGQAVCAYAMNLAIEKAESSGVTFIGIVNCNHAGCLFDYTLMAAERGLIGFMVANSERAVAPAGGTQPILGTNPICIAAPVKDAWPIVLDMATSAITWGAVVQQQRRGRKLPDGLILNHYGDPSDDPGALIGPPIGAILPLAGYKGYGLALLVDILGGALTGAGCGGEIGPGSQGVAMMAINPRFFGDPNEFTERLSRLVQRLKKSPKMPGTEEILLPGEREFRLQKDRSLRGIPLPHDIWVKLDHLAQEIGMSS